MYSRTCYTIDKDIRQDADEPPSPWADSARPAVSGPRWVVFLLLLRHSLRVSKRLPTEQALRPDRVRTPDSRAGTVRHACRSRAITKPEPRLRTTGNGQLRTRPSQR